MDTDKNDLVDALELMSTIALLSGMDTIEKLHFVFSIFDFTSKAVLNIDAVTLMMRSVTNGLVKIAPYRVNPSLAEVDSIAMLMAPNGSLTVADYQKFCTSDLVITSWLKCYSSLDPVKVSSPSNIPSSIVHFIA